MIWDKLYMTKGDNYAEKALQLLAQMRRKGLEPDAITNSACAKGDNNAEKALQLLAEMQRKGLEPNVITYIALINACAKGKKQRRLCNFWRRCSGRAWSRM